VGAIVGGSVTDTVGEPVTVGVGALEEVGDLDEDGDLDENGDLVDRFLPLFLLTMCTLF